MRYTDIIAGGLLVMFIYMVIGPAVAGAYILPYLVETWTAASTGGVGADVPGYVGALLSVAFALFIWKHTFPILLLMGSFTWVLDAIGVFA